MITVEQRWIRAELQYHEDAVARLEAAADDGSRTAQIAVRRIGLRADVIRRVLTLVEQAQV